MFIIIQISINLSLIRIGNAIQFRTPDSIFMALDSVQLRFTKSVLKTVSCLWIWGRKKNKPPTPEYNVFALRIASRDDNVFKISQLTDVIRFLIDTKSLSFRRNIHFYLIIEIIVSKCIVSPFGDKKSRVFKYGHLYGHRDLVSSNSVSRELILGRPPVVTATRIVSSSQDIWRVKYFTNPHARSESWRTMPREPLSKDRLTK